MGINDPNWKLLDLQMPFWKTVSERYFRAEFEGWERLPDEPSLLISVHGGAALTIDAWVFVFNWLQRFGKQRPLHGTAHDVLMALPGLGHYFRSAGVIPASKEGVTEALDRGHDVIVWPGGEQDSMRSWRKRDEVVLAGRHGFVKQAMRSRVPIVPVATVGGGDTIFVLSEGRWIVNALDKLTGLKSKLRGATLPIVAGPLGVRPEVVPAHVPLPAKLRYEILDPIEVDPDRADDRDYVHSVYLQVEEALQQGVDRLAERRSLPVFA